MTRSGLKLEMARLVAALVSFILAFASPGIGLAAERFHALVTEGPAIVVEVPMIIVGLEKGGKRKVGAIRTDVGTSDDCRLGEHCLRLGGEPGSQDSFQKQFNVLMERRRDRPMYVSHIVALTGSRSCKIIYPTGNATTCGANGGEALLVRTPDLVEKSWDALEINLKHELLEQYRSECARARCPTHVFVLSTGWTQDEQSSLKSYQEWARNISDDLKGRGDGARPMFVGLAWPSGWYLPYISFINKAHDADEAGFIWGSVLVNRTLAQLHREVGLKTVLVGHSLGAKILTSAVAGKVLIESEACDGDSGLTVVGLQAAFSTGRFVDGYGNEGSPYRDVRTCGTRLAYTVSRADKGIQVAPMQVFTRKTGYVGGKKGFELARLDNNGVFATARADRNASLHFDPPVDGFNSRILLMDSTAGIHCHGDVADPYAAHLITSVVLGDFSGTDGVVDSDDACKRK